MEDKEVNNKLFAYEDLLTDAQGFLENISNIIIGASYTTDLFNIENTLNYIADLCYDKSQQIKNTQKELKG